MTTETTITLKEAIATLAALVPKLDELKSAGQAAKENLDEAGQQSVEAERDELLTAHATAFDAIGGDKSIPSGRRALVCRAAATSPKPAELRKLATAAKVGTVDGITLPEGRFSNLSRGKSWCRVGSGSSAQWIDADNGHRITEPGKYTVGSSDGFSRKEQTPWTVFVCCGYFCAD